MKRFLEFSILALVVTVGCHGQVPKPTTPTVVLTCTAPASFVAGSGNGFVFARAICATASTCPSNVAGNTSFVQLNASPVTACAYTDNTPPTGALVIYTASTVQGGQTSVPSSPSNSGVPASVPVVPGAPGGLGGAVQSAALAPPLIHEALPKKIDASLPQPGVVMARVVMP